MLGRVYVLWCVLGLTDIALLFTETDTSGATRVTGIVGDPAVWLDTQKISRIHLQHDDADQATESQYTAITHRSVPVKNTVRRSEQQEFRNIFFPNINIVTHWKSSSKSWNSFSLLVPLWPS